MASHTIRTSPLVALTLLVAAGCGGQDGPDGSAANNGGGGAAGTDSLPQIGVFDRANLSYADNLLQKVEDGEWTLGEGIVDTLRAFAGEEPETNILRHEMLNSYEGTGVFRMAREYLRDGEDAAAQTEISRLLDLFEFSVSELEDMAGLTQGASQRVSKGAVENCRRFFERFKNPAPGVGVCLKVETVTINGVEHRIFLPADPLPPAGWDETHLSQTINTLQDSVPVYTGLGSIPRLNIVFSVNAVPNVWGGAFPDGLGECGIAVYTGLQAQPQENFQQLLAHEIAHCVQGETWSPQIGPHYNVIKWFFEGGAEYWSNLVYPEVNLEWRHLPALQLNELATLLHHRSYENFIFFQYLGSVIGNEGIATLISGLPDDVRSGIVEQREATAEFSNMERVFHEFAQALTDSRVQDTNGELIPFAARAVNVEVHDATAQIVRVPLLLPFATYRFLLSAEDEEQADLEFRESGPMASSTRRAAQGVSTGSLGTVVESVVDTTGARPWSTELPREVPDEDCDSARQMILATATESPVGGANGQLTGASFEMDVRDIDGSDCCLHGQWVMTNQDLADADSQALGVETTYSGRLTADYRSDGTVLFSWGSFTRVFDDTNGPVTSVISGAGVQFYEVRFDGLLEYNGPELTVSVMETAPFDQNNSFTAVLDTALGDQQTSQFFECTDESLVTTIRGSVRIGWTRTN